MNRDEKFNTFNAAITGLLANSDNNILEAAADNDRAYSALIIELAGNFVEAAEEYLNSKEWD